MILAKFWSNLLISWRTFEFKLLNVPARVRAIVIHKYKSPPLAWLSASIFTDIQNKVQPDKINRRASHERAMTLYSERLGISITVSLDEEPDTSTIGTDKPLILAYSAKVNMEADYRLGFRNVEDFQDFVSLASVIQDCVQERCFQNEKPYETFTVCKIKRDAKLVVRKTGKIHDDRLKVDVTTQEDAVEIVSREPTYLTSALKKYFPI